MPEVIEAVGLAFREKGLRRVQMPAKTYLYYKRYNGDLRTMPSYLEELDISAVKIVNVHPENPDKHKIPTVMAIVVLIEPSTGSPYAIMGGSTLTDMRTGAAGGIAAKYLAKKEPKTVGLIGAGAQSRTQLMALVEIYKKFEEVKVWSRSSQKTQKFAAEIEQHYGHLFKITPEEKLKKATENTDILVTTTPSREPLIMNDMVGSGTHINCIGADAAGKQELDPLILKRAKIVVDDWEQASHSGEINVPLRKKIISEEDIWAEIGEIVAGLKPGRQSNEEITVFTSTGLGVQDAVTAKIAYDKALKTKIGNLTKIL